MVGKPQSYFQIKPEFTSGDGKYFLHLFSFVVGRSHAASEKNYDFVSRVTLAVNVDWLDAVTQINTINTCQLPCEKLKCLINTAEAIYKHINLNMQRKCMSDGTSATVIVSADDFTPIFVYCVFRSDTPDLYSQVEYMWECCAPRLMMGKGGYCK